MIQIIENFLMWQIPINNIRFNAVVLTLSIFFALQIGAFSQSADFHGQASTWLTGVEKNLPVSQTGFRFIPDLFLEKHFSNGLFVDSEIAINGYITGNFLKDDDPEKEWDVKPYRLWLRFGSDKFEARLGLQKINFGSATLFRPLMWFDHVDPRDPLKMTDGVYAMLLRYYFENNANIWLWGLCWNKDLKGWEIAPTEDKTFEFGGRFQFPLFTGETGLTWHHRKADFSDIYKSALLPDKGLVDENRYGFDTKWDIVIGVWLEGVVTHRDTEIAYMKYQRMWTIGADYTFDIGNGLNVLTEYFDMKNSETLTGDGEGAKFSGISTSYPIGLLDLVSAIYYYNWTNRLNYLSLNWQRTYDNWAFHLTGFYNPESAGINETQKTNSDLPGKGFQIVIVYNY